MQFTLRTMTRFGLLALLALVWGMAGFNMTSLNAQPEPTPTPTSIPVPEGWALVWNDEFEGDSINPAHWTYEIGGHGWGNAELQYYSDRAENARIEDGMLVIEAHRKNFQGMKYTSARLVTKGLQEFQYGRIESRLKVPAGAGLWPAFWMLGANIDKVRWPTCGELDIMEYVGREPNTIFGTMHGPGYSGAAGISKKVHQETPVADEFHTFAIEWEKEEVRWFYDDTLYHTLKPTDLGYKVWVFDQPFFIILNLAVGGNFGGTVAKETVFPAQYLVDYVRVYQRRP